MPLIPKLLYKLPMVSACLLTALTIAINPGSATSQQTNNHSTGATNQKPSTHTYPDEVVKRYVDACVANGGSAAICACTIRGLQKKYSLEEFLTLGSNLETGGEVPNSLTEIAMTCLSGNGN